MNVIKLVLIFVVILIFSSFSLLSPESNLFKPISLTGKIDKYGIDMEILTYDRLKQSFTGKYKYKSQKTFLEIKGDVIGTCVSIDEFSKGKNTGSFYLDMDGDSIRGWWLNEKKSFKVSLKEKTGRITSLLGESLTQKANKTNTKITGAYGVEYYWVNDHHNSSDNPSVEIGFNGGYACFKELENGNLQFQLEVVCGPTYHIAYAEGIAEKKDDKYVYITKDYSDGDDSPCEITFTPGKKTIRAVANLSFICGFGARAHLDHEFIKISDTPSFGEGVSLDGIKKL